MRSRFLRDAFATAAVVASASASTAAPHPIVDRVYHCTLIARAQDLAPLGVSGAPFLRVGAASIENSGRVVYFGEGFLPSGLGGGIFRGRFDVGGSLAPTPLVETFQSDASSPVRVFLGEPLADFSDVFFKAGYADGGSQRAGLFRNYTLVLDLQGAGEYAYDAGGSRAYAIQLDIGSYPNIESRLYLGTQQVDSVPSGIGSISGLSVASNVSGMVSYGRFDGAGFEVRVWAGTPLVYVDSDDDALMASGSSGPGVPTSINEYGEVALVAGDGAELARRVFMADGDVIHRVLCENDGILPHLIGSRAINSAGQIAFVGTDGQGQAVMARADPLQGLPVSYAGLDAGSACDDGDPATIAFCENTECVPVSLSVPEPDAPALLLAALALLPRHN